MATRKKNYFAALDETDHEEKIQTLFAPSFLAGAPITAPQSLPTASSSAGVSSAPSAGEVDLKGVVDELHNDVADLHASTPVTWNFDAFKDASVSAQQQWQAEADAARLAKEREKKQMEEHLARLHASDQERLQEKLLLQSASTKQNARKKAAAEKADAVKERLSGKVAKNKAHQRLKNLAKNLY